MSNNEEVNAQASGEKLKYDIFGGVFVVGFGALSILSGFAVGIAMAKKQDSKLFKKEVDFTHAFVKSGGSLAFRAMCLGSLCAIGGVGILTCVIWKGLGAEKFKNQVQAVLPAMPKKKNVGRSDFESLADLADYLVTEDEKKLLKQTAE